MFMSSIFGLVFSIFSFGYTLIKSFSKKSKSYFNREMETYYIGTKN